MQPGYLATRENVTPLGTQHKTYENSSDYTSDEDFDFLEK